MSYKQIIITVCTALMVSPLFAKVPTIDLSQINGNWHLRIMDGMEVRKARAILDFDSDKMRLSGFDACNRISGVLKVNNDTNISSRLISTKMACRGKIQSYVSQRLHETINEGFSISKAKRNGVEGITLKSPTHELFFGKMGK